MCLVRRTASCWDTLDCSAPSARWISSTLRSPTTSNSRMRMRSGWASALKNSALNACSRPWGSLSGTTSRIYKYSNASQRRSEPRGDLGGQALELLQLVEDGIEQEKPGAGRDHRAQP